MSIKSQTTQRTLQQLEEITGSTLSFGHLLASIREAEALSLAEFSHQLGISKQYLCDLEHHRKLPSPQLAASYAEKLGYSCEQFVRLAIQEKLNQAGLYFQVELSPLDKISHQRLPHFKSQRHRLNKTPLRRSR